MSWLLFDGRGQFGLHVSICVEEIPVAAGCDVCRTLQCSGDAKVRPRGKGCPDHEDQEFLSCSVSFYDQKLLAQRLLLGWGRPHTHIESRAASWDSSGSKKEISRCGSCFWVCEFQSA